MTLINTLLHDVPEELFIQMLVGWITLVDLVKLDTACCNSDCRKHFQRLISGQKFVIPSMIVVNNTKSYVLWLTKRNVKATNFVLEGDVDSDLLPGLINCSAGDCTNIVKAKNLKTSTKDLLNLLSKRCKMVRRVSLQHCRDAFGIADLAQYSSQALQSLCIVDCTLSSPAESALPAGQQQQQDQDEQGPLDLPSLRRVYLDCDYGNPALQAFATAGTGLHQLHVVNASFDAPTLQRLSQRAVASLLVLEFNMCEFSPGEALLVQLAKACKNLRQLALVQCPAFTGSAAIAFVTHCTQLEAIALDGPSFNAQTITALARHVGPRLRHLSLYECACDSDASLTELAASCQGMESLQFFLTGAYSLPALANVIAAQTCLREVSFKHAQIDDRILAALAASTTSTTLATSTTITSITSSTTTASTSTRATQLTYLDLHGATGYTATGLAHLARRCPALQSVCVEEESELIPGPVRAFWRGFVPNVRFYHGYNCMPHWEKAYAGWVM